MSRAGYLESKQTKVVFEKVLGIMSRYFENDGNSRSQETRQGESSNRIGRTSVCQLMSINLSTFEAHISIILFFLVLPEFIPFTNDFDNDQKDQVPIPPPPRETRSPSFRNSDRNSDHNSEGRFSNRRIQEVGRRENGNDRNSSRESFRSQPQYSKNRNNRTISPPRSPLPNNHESYQRRSRSPQKFDRRNPDKYRRSSERPSNDNRHSSVFDRISSPRRRRFRDTSVSRRSHDSNSNGPSPHFYRTIETNNLANSRFETQIKPNYCSNELSIDPFRANQRNMSPNFGSRDALSFDVGRFEAGPSRLVDENYEIRDLR